MAPWWLTIEAGLLSNQLTGVHEWNSNAARRGIRIEAPIVDSSVRRYIRRFCNRLPCERQSSVSVLVSTTDASSSLTVLGRQFGSSRFRKRLKAPTGLNLVCDSPVIFERMLNSFAAVTRDNEANEF